MLRKTSYESPQVLQQVSVLLEKDLLGDSQNAVQGNSVITTEGQSYREVSPDMSDASWLD